MISDKLVYELQAIIKNDYGKDLSFEETARIGNDLVEVYDVIAEIDFREKYNRD